MLRRCVFCLAAVLWLSSDASARRPNVLLIVGDDHRDSVMGAYGDKLAQTPNLDRLAAEGVRFDRAYANCPMCTPSRQSFLTGRYPHAVGVTLLGHTLDDDRSYTLAERLRDAGYRTGAFGKMHFNSKLLHGFEVHRRPEDFHAEHGKRPADRPLPAGVEVLPPWRPFKDHARVWLNGRCLPVGRYDDEMPASWYVAGAIEFMKQHRNEPFFVQVGFHQPHSPFQFPVEYQGRFEPADMVVPPIGPEDVPQIPKIFADLAIPDKQGIKAAYYTAVAYLDQKCGELLKAVDELGLKDDTLVIYLGDHGYHLGEHGRFEKHCFYENAVRAPLLVRLPSRIPGGRSSNALVEFVDIVPTVLDYLDVTAERNAAPPRDLHGLSLRPLIEDKSSGIRDAVFSEYQPTNEAMIRTHRYKLIYRTPGPVASWMGYEPLMPSEGRVVKLFDVHEDPEEFRNLAGDPDHAQIVKDLLGRLADWYRRTTPEASTGSPPPDHSSPEARLDWAIPPR